VKKGVINSLSIGFVVIDAEMYRIVGNRAEKMPDRRRCPIRQEERNPK
jgi:phage head maturation protease